LQDYVDQIAKEEARELAKESRVERGLKADSVTEV
jgi:hypothetical protein